MHLTVLKILLLAIMLVFTNRLAWARGFESLEAEPIWRPQAYSGWAYMPVAASVDIKQVDMSQATANKEKSKLGEPPQPQTHKKIRKKVSKFVKRSKKTYKKRVSSSKQTKKTVEKKLHVRSDFDADLGALLGLVEKKHYNHKVASKKYQVTTFRSAAYKNKRVKNKKAFPKKIKKVRYSNYLRELALIRAVQPVLEKKQETAKLPNAFIKVTARKEGSKDSIHAPAMADMDQLLSVIKGQIKAESLSQELLSVRTEVSPVRVSRTTAKTPKRDEVAEKEARVADTGQPQGVVSDNVSMDFYSQPAAYEWSNDELSLVDVTVQIVDDRSDHSGKALYPVADLKVNILGTDLAATSDSMGQVRFEGIPDRSRYAVFITDPEGRIYPAVKEVSVDPSSPDLQTVHVMRKFTLESYTKTASTYQRADLASLCSQAAYSEDTPMAGVEVSLSVKAEGPFYFNEYGLIDPSLKSTSSNGRFCFFNIQPGLAVVKFAWEDRSLETPIAALAGVHKETTFDLDNGNNEGIVGSHLSLIAPSHKQLDSDTEQANRQTQVDYANLIPLGHKEPWNSVAPGLVESDKHVVRQSGRFWLYTYGPSFEPTIQSYQGDLNSVVSLMPRGFMEDMALAAQIAFNASQGHAFVEYGHWQGLEEDVDIQIYNLNTAETTQPWYFSSHPVSKSIFFNLQAGAYAAIVKDKNGQVLGSETFLIYDKATTYVKIGNRIITRK